MSLCCYNASIVKCLTAQIIHLAIIFFCIWLVETSCGHPQRVRANIAVSDTSLKGKVFRLSDGKRWVLVQSTAQTGTKTGYVYIMAIDSYGTTTWGTSYSDPNAAIATTADLASTYTNLPSIIGDVAKAAALGSHTWQWDYCSDDSSPTCFNSVTSTSRLSMVSYREFQGGYNAFNSEPPAGSVGQLFCTAWKNSPCIGSLMQNISGSYPWTRSGNTIYTNTAWVMEGWYTQGGWMSSLNGRSVAANSAFLPVAWLSSSVTINTAFATSGTYSSPYCLTGDNSCNTSPTLTLANPAASANLNSATVTVSGTVTDPDAQTLTIRYNLNTTTNNGTLTGGSQLTTSA